MVLPIKKTTRFQPGMFHVKHILSSPGRFPWKGGKRLILFQLKKRPQFARVKTTHTFPAGEERFAEQGRSCRRLHLPKYHHCSSGRLRRRRVFSVNRRFIVIQIGLLLCDWCKLTASQPSSPKWLRASWTASAFGLRKAEPSTSILYSHCTSSAMITPFIF